MGFIELRLPRYSSEGQTFLRVFFGRLYFTR
jgi:hypothetical protein